MTIEEGRALLNELPSSKKPLSPEGQKEYDESMKGSFAVFIRRTPQHKAPETKPEDKKDSPS